MVREMRVTQSDSQGFEPQQQDQWLKNNESAHSLTPPSFFCATQVVWRTSVLRKLTRTSLSERRMPGMWPCDQQVRKAVLLAYVAFRVSDKGIRVHLPWDSPQTAPEKFLPQELWYRSRGQPVGDHPCSNISPLIVFEGEHILVFNIPVRGFGDSGMTSDARNVCQFTHLSHPLSSLCHSSKKKRFSSISLMSLMFLGTQRLRCLKEQVMAAPQ